MGSLYCVCELRNLTLDRTLILHPRTFMLTSPRMLRIFVCQPRGTTSRTATGLGYGIGPTQRRTHSGKHGPSNDNTGCGKRDRPESIPRLIRRAFLFIFSWLAVFAATVGCSSLSILHNVDVCACFFFCTTSLSEFLLSTGVEVWTNACERYMYCCAWKYMHSVSRRKMHRWCNVSTCFMQSNYHDLVEMMPYRWIELVGGLDN